MSTPQEVYHVIVPHYSPPDPVPIRWAAIAKYNNLDHAMLEANRHQVARVIKDGKTVYEYSRHTSVEDFLKSF